jgi:dTDP-4-dehydrorhamnose reductase
MNGLKVLVTGATGFVGTALRKRMGHENFCACAAVLAADLAMCLFMTRYELEISRRFRVLMEEAK